jgi:VCBS repeat-containing protein
MPTFASKAATRPLAMLTGGLLAASVLFSTATPAIAQPPVAHWGNYQWFGGQEQASVRAFWLADRTGNADLNAIIQYVADTWNGARTDHPELPYIGLYRDDANAGQCFVNQTPGYSIASACMMPSLAAFGIKGITATHGSPHFVGGAFAISDGLSVEEAITVVCHNFGHLMGLPDSDSDQSCMKHDSAPGQVKWYTLEDADAALALYGHDDGQAPAAVADTYSTTEDVALTVNAPGVLSNDSDVDGDALSAVKVADPTHGALTLNADGSFTYTPDANFNGTDSFTYEANGAGTASNAASVTITVTPVSDVPVAVADSYSSGEDVGLTVDAPGVLGNDTDPEGGLTAVKLTEPTHGAVILNADGSFTYTPAADFNGTDSFTYEANDGTADSNTVTVTITVRPVNDAPVAVADAHTTTMAVPLLVSAPGVLGNDTDVEGGALTAVMVTTAAHGAVTLNADGSFTYTPDLDFTGSDAFTYKANDGTADSNVASVTIDVGLLVTAAEGR